MRHTGGLDLSFNINPNESSSLLGLFIAIRTKLTKVTILHPTKEKLIQTYLELLKTNNFRSITSEMVLETSGITKGSLYHHFEDFNHLIETVRIVKFSRWVDSSIEIIGNLIASSKTKEDVVKALHEVTVSTQNFSQSSRRLERTETISLTLDNERFHKALSVEQTRLTTALTDIIREAIEKEFIRKDLDPQVLAVFIQAYTLGKIVDDINPNRIDEDKWVSLIEEILLKVLLV